MRDRKKVVITGGSSGIGSALVVLFAQSGYEVLFSYCHGEHRAHKLCEELQAFPVTCAHLNQGEPASVEAFLALLPDDIDCMIINGGLGSKTVEKETTDVYAQDEAFMKVNALGPLWLCRTLIPKMEQRKSGKVILVSSVGGGIAPFTGFRFAEQMSKAALAYMGKQYAAMLAGSSVDIFTVCPGATDTPMFQASTMNSMSPKEEQTFFNSLAGHRLIEVDEIARLCLYLCSDAGKILRGGNIDASLGLGSAPWMIEKHRESR